MAREKITDAERIERIKSKLHCSDKEAEDILLYDKKIDADKKDKIKYEYDLDDGRQKVASKYTRTGTRKTPTVYNFGQRKHKSNATKAGIISELMEFLSTNSQFSIENLEAVKPEQLISFKIGEKKFSLTLTQHRK